jgi:hypothetical protein
MKWERPLELTRVDVALQRPPGQTKTLTRLAPASSVVHLNTRIPEWPGGPATLHVEVDSELGALVLEAEVWLKPGSESRVQLISPRKELARKQVLIQEGAGGSRESGPAEGGSPAAFLFFPSGGRLSTTFSTRLLVKTLDREGRPARGSLQLDGNEEQKADSDGIVEVLVAEGGAPRKLRLNFEGEQGRLSGTAYLVGEPTQLDAAAGELLVRAGRSTTVHLRSLAASALLYLEAWWLHGWCYTGQVKTRDGEARCEIPVGPGIQGPLVVRVRDNPFGEGKARRDVVVLVGKHGLPTLQDGLTQLRKLPADEGFWESFGQMSSGERNLRALLSRVSAEPVLLPQLADGSEAERQAVTRKKADLRAFGLGASALVSVIAWLAVARLLLGTILAERRARPGSSRKRLLGFALGALSVTALALGGGWFLLRWLTG